MAAVDASDNAVQANRPSQIARGASRSLLFRLAQIVTDTLVVVVTARAFGAEGRGLYSLTTLAAAFAITPLGGVAAPIAAEIAHGREKLSRLNGASLAVSVAGGGSIALVLAAIALAVWPHWEFLLFAATAAPALLLAVCQQAIYQALGDVRHMHYSLLFISTSVLVAITAVALVWPGHVLFALAAWVIACSVVPALMLGDQRRRFGIRVRGVSPLLRRLLYRGAPVSLANGIIRLNYRVDIIVVAALLPLASVGRYSVSVAGAETLWLFSRAITTGAYATITGGRDKASANATLAAFRHSFLLLAAGGVLGVIAARFLVGPIFGTTFNRAWIPLALLVPGIAGLGIAEILRAYVLIRLERRREYLIASLGGMIINLVLAVLLVPILGLNGAALSTSVAYLASGAYMLIRFAKLSGLTDYRGYVPRGHDLTVYWDLCRELITRIGKSRLLLVLIGVRRGER